MRKQLSIMFTLLVFVTSSQGQTKSAATPLDQKFYFPVSLYDDPVALNNAIPSLAKKVIADFSDKEKKNFKKLADYYFLAQDYQKVSAAVDSFEKKGDVVTGMALKAYAIAKTKENEKPGSFD